MDAVSLTPVLQNNVFTSLLTPLAGLSWLRVAERIESTCNNRTMVHVAEQ